ncbi:MAG: hypothetical protein R3305_06055, partial [Gammaproteobacteria bacterium]|nr:hypothetical protein [Gammaproteobacteria bacterium]
YLHVAFDLAFHDGRGTFWLPANQPGLAPFERAPVYRLNYERNRILRGDPHYIDHPLFGILIRITRAPESEERETGATEPAA